MLQYVTYTRHHSCSDCWKDHWETTGSYGELFILT